MELIFEQIHIPLAASKELQNIQSNGSTKRPFMFYNLLANAMPSDLQTVDCCCLEHFLRFSSLSFRFPVGLLTARDTRSRVRFALFF